MTVDGEEKKIVLLTEGDEMKGKCEEKDLQLDELFGLRWRKRRLQENR